MQFEEAAIEKIVVAMKLSGVKKMTEGAMYWALFQQGFDTDKATAVMKHAEHLGLISRKNYIVGLANDEKNTRRPGRLCDS
jgi:2-hydroxychromene-2-carboxylate isomerase